MIKTIFFDAAGTLFHLPKGVGWHYRDVAGRFGCALEEKMLSPAFYTVWKQMPGRSASHQPRPDDDKGWWFSLVEQVLDQCGIPPGQLPRSEYFEQLYAEFTRPGIWELFPETREVLALLREKYRLGVISNFDGRLRPILASLGLGDWFDPLVISSEMGADKPDPWIFQQALALAEPPPPKPSTWAMTHAPTGRAPKPPACTFSASSGPPIPCAISQPRSLPALPESPASRSQS